MTGRTGSRWASGSRRSRVGSSASRASASGPHLVNDVHQMPRTGRRERRSPHCPLPTIGPLYCLRCVGTWSRLLAGNRTIVMMGHGTPPIHLDVPVIGDGLAKPYIPQEKSSPPPDARPFEDAPGVEEAATEPASPTPAIHSGAWAAVVGPRRRSSSHSRVPGAPGHQSDAPVASREAG